MGKRKSSAGLRKVLKYLEDPRNTTGYVVTLLARFGYENSKVYQNIRRLDTPGYSVKIWLAMESIAIESFLRRASLLEVYNAMRQYRISWVKAMVEWYEKAGD